MARTPAFLSTEKAADMIGVSEEFFEEMVADQSDWMRPIWLGKGGRRLKRWDSEDVRAIIRIHKGRLSAPPERKKSDAEPKSE